MKFNSNPTRSSLFISLAVSLLFFGCVGIIEGDEYGQEGPRYLAGNSPWEAQLESATVSGARGHLGTPSGESSGTGGGSECVQQGGACYDSNTQSCSIASVSNLCPGSSNITCCKASVSDKSDDNGTGNSDICAENGYYNDGFCDTNCANPDPDCSASGTDTGGTNTPGSDTPTTNDVCEENGYYSDGFCDTNCANPDPDCSVSGNTGSTTDVCEENGFYGDGFCDTNCANPDPDCSSNGPNTGIAAGAESATCLAKWLVAGSIVGEAASKSCFAIGVTSSATGVGAVVALACRVGDRLELDRAIGAGISRILFNAAGALGIAQCGSSMTMPDIDIGSRPTVINVPDTNTDTDSQTQTCTNARKAELKTKKDFECNRPRRCNSMHSCEELISRKTRNQLCVEARKQVVRECFGNMPDQVHEDEINEAYGVLSSCQMLIDAPNGACGL